MTAPRGNNTGTQPRASVSPLPFLRGLKRAHAQFDVYAHHPYYQHPTESPGKPPPGPRAITLGNINELLRELKRLYGNKHLWITEYGYQTKPPDRAFGVSWTKQAAYLSQAYSIARRNPRIDMMLWFLLRDEDRLDGWQSGLLTVTGQRKPSFEAFRRMPRLASSSRGNWSVPAPIACMKPRFFARPRRPFSHSPEITSTSASPIRSSNVSRSRTAKLLIPVSKAENRSCSR